MDAPRAKASRINVVDGKWSGIDDITTGLKDISHKTIYVFDGTTKQFLLKAVLQ